eukprot:6204897-Pleurochrysis_carterae.AAC.1
MPPGRPATPVGKAGCGGTAAGEETGGVAHHGKFVSSKYTSEVTTMRKPGTSTRKALGDWLSRPRFTPTQARESMRVLETAGRGLT